MTREVVVLSGMRTAIGTFGGSLKEVPPTQLAAHVVRASLEKAQVDGGEVGHVVFGHVINTEPRDMYLSRVAAIEGGCGEDTPAFNVNRLCASGLQAVISASQSILLGDTDIAIAGGAESMSRGPHSSPTMRWGSRMSDGVMLDMMLGALHDPFHKIHMGVTGENVAAKWGITREAQDELALESHRRAERATQNGYFRDQIAPLVHRTRSREVVFDQDEHFRADATMADFAGLKPVFAKDGTVTAGNASGINDAAAALVLMEREVAVKRGAKPMARLVAYAHAGVDPRYMGIGPVPATRMALKRAGLTIADMAVIEANEAFAAQACAVARELDFDARKVNPNGSGISLGHPIGATGAINTIKAIHELQRTGGRYALVTMCVGGGQGIAAIFENLEADSVGAPRTQ